MSGVPPAFALDGVHHVTAITADAQRNLDFYVGTLGLRLIKKSINQGNPHGYHLFYGDEQARPGADITFFPYPRLPRGRAGAGMVGRIVWRLASVAAVDFWERRLVDLGVGVSRSSSDAVVLADPDGLSLELAVVGGVADEPLCGIHPSVPSEFALQGLHAVRAFDDHEGTGLDALLGFDAGGEARGPSRGGFYWPEELPDLRALKGAGTVHHVAWAIADDAYEFWEARLSAAGVDLVEVVDRYYFRSIYFHIPGGVLFELATLGPGFTIDEPPASLGTTLSVPPAFAALRQELEATLPPLVDPRQDWAGQPSKK